MFIMMKMFDNYVIDKNVSACMHACVSVCVNYDKNTKDQYTLIKQSFKKITNQ